MRILAVIFLFTTIGFSQEKLDAALLWKIEGKQFTNPVYIFGTMHLISEEAYYFPKKLEKLIAKSDEVVLEIAEIDANATNLSALILEEGSMLDDFNQAQKDSIFSWIEVELHLSEEDFTKAFGKFKPIVLVQLAAQKNVGFNAKSYEKEIAAIAEKKNVRITGLETIDQQIGFFDSLSQQATTKMVMESIRHSHDDSLTTLMESYYKGQNIDELYELIHNSASSISEHESIFLEQRNINWIKAIEKMEDQQLFIAVGAGHLGGPQGLIRLLREKGFTLTPIEL